jgi:serine/threonine-protein kinase
VRPDLVILGAAEVMGALRADPLTRDSKVLLVVDESSGRDPRAAGADERLAMPFSPLQLQVKLRKLLGAHAVG